MLSKKDDQKICSAVSNKIASRGIRAPSHVHVTCNNGEVTLSGSVVQAHQKNAATHAAEGIQGVRRVYDRLVVKAVVKRSDDGNGEWAVRPTKAMTIAAEAEADATAEAAKNAAAETPPAAVDLPPEA